ncbi:MAG: hypothetical protein HC897_17400, partial [Thermoanaerobaculia bacterium]|nr:hypothetical protein [Thermoanaerobaculia bacterium]
MKTTARISLVCTLALLNLTPALLADEAPGPLATALTSPALSIGSSR